MSDQRGRIFKLGVLGPALVGLLLAGAVPAHAQQQQLERVAPVAAGDPFPLGSVKNMNEDSGAPGVMDLAQHRGKQSLVLYYWIAGNERSEELFKELETYVAELGGDKLALYGVAYQQPGRDMELIRKRMSRHGLKSPVIDDVGFQLGQRLRVSSVPNISIVDADGVLRFTNGGSLRHEVERDLTLRDVLRRAAEGKSVGTYGYLDMYHPVSELVGSPMPDVQAAKLRDGKATTLTAMLDPKRLNMFVYWSVECGHCRRWVPKFQEWLRDNPGTVNVMTAASSPNDVTRIKTREFMDLKNILLPTVLDEDGKVGDLYKISTTPTILLIRPDGVVDSVLQSNEDFAAEIKRAKDRLGIQ